MKRIAPFLLLLVAACDGGEAPAPRIDVVDARARAIVAGQTATAAYLTLRNSGGADELLGVTTEGAEASLHSTDMSGGIMRMRPLESLPIPANSTVRLEPAGTHIMITALQTPLTAGKRLPLVLRFKRSGEQRIDVPAVADPSAPAHGVPH